MTFHYENTGNVMCEGKMEALVTGRVLELDIEANGYRFHALVGSHRDGNFLCIPNWNIGSELAGLDDEFWNEERLRNYTTMDPDSIRAVVRAVRVAGKQMDG